MGFTAYAQLRLPQVAQQFTHLGFPDYFRLELSWAKFPGVVLLTTPVPARLKDWAYAGFAIDLASALITHLAVGHDPEIVEEVKWMGTPFFSHSGIVRRGETYKNVVKLTCQGCCVEGPFRSIQLQHRKECPACHRRPRRREDQ
jgi:hypothetical protein